MTHSITREGARECETRMEGGAVKIIGSIESAYLESMIHNEHLGLAVLEPEIRIDVTDMETTDETLFEVIFDYLRKGLLYSKRVTIITRRGSVVDRDIRSHIDVFHYELELI
ncbi:MAG: hypothetical protein M1324_01370 [Patescibacteria group bacterium]|nr:hypothetical protein [Patescibacteria group bacterium]